MIPSDIQILKKVRQTIEKYNLFEPGDKIIVAVSGGADSVCLLNILNSLKKDLNISIHIAHLNHLLREKESERDAEFVRETAELLLLPFTIEKRDIKALKKKLKTSTQAAARTARIDFLQRLKNKINASKIALGHTLDDRVETVLINLIRGSGVSGIAGMDFFNQKYSIIRPLMDITRKEVETYLSSKKIKFVTDSSNVKKNYLRNRIRLELIPLLENSFNPQIRKRIADTAQILSAEDVYLETQAEEFFKFILTKGSNDLWSTTKLNRQDINELILNINLMKVIPVPIVYRIIRKALWRLNSNITNLSFSHTDKVFSLITEGRTGASLNLPGKIKAQKLYNKIIFSKSDKKEFQSLKETKVAVPGKTKLLYLNKTLNTVVLQKNSVKFITKDKNLGLFDYQKVKLPLTIRNKRDGDRFIPLGMNKPKKLKDYFIDRKIPQQERKKIPLLVSDGEIMWVIGERISDKFKVTTSTKDVLLIGLV